MKNKIIFGIVLFLIFITPVIAKTDLEKILDKSDEIYDLVNRPIIDVYGTDYFIGEKSATTFLQLLDANHQPIVNSTCFASFWYPDKSPFIADAVMIYKDEGLYYRDYNLPQYEGIYMISAKCEIPTLAQQYSQIQVAEDFFTSGTFIGGTGWIGDWDLTGTPQIVTGDYVSANYSARLTETDRITRTIDASNQKNLTISFWTNVNGFEAGDAAYFKIDDGFEQTIKGWVDGDDDNIWKYYEFELVGFNPCFNFEISFVLNGDSSNDFFWVDNVNITGYNISFIFGNFTEYQEVRGSGEVHVIDPVSTIINGTSLLDEILWNFQFDRDNPTLLSNHDYCIDNTTLGKTLTYEYCVGSNCRNIIKNETIPCEYGCQNNACLNPPFNWAIVFGFIFIGLIVVAVLKNAKF